MKLLINDNIFKCKVCSTPESVKEGMMNKTFDGFDCMVFLMEQKTNQNFWMYNCIVPLDIVMVNDNVITSVNHFCPPCEVKNECDTYDGYGNIVLEFLGGTCNELNIKEGDKIKLSFF
jgi:uncharacterized membrane protein (UPF0127 family)